MKYAEGLGMRLLAICFVCAGVCGAQTPAGQPRSLPPEMQKQLDAARARAAAAAGAVPGGAVTKPGAMPGKAASKPGAKPKAAPKSSATVKRPDKPAAPPNPLEFNAKPDSNGMLQFNFQGQPWPAVLQWLADVSDMSLNWEELPGGYLNLTTQRDYTVDGTRDLVNGYLINRGFTILIVEQTMQVIKIKDLTTASVPRITPDQLADRLPNEFVRVSFKLDWLIAESVVGELKPMLGKYGKLHQLATTNRVEAIDTVANLRAVHQLLQEEQSDTGQQRLIRAFVLKHRRAVDVIDMIKELVGIEKSASKAKPPAANAMQAQQMMMQRAMQAQAGKKPKAAAPAPEVHLVLNQRENSILAHAPPNKMAEIEQAIKALDVPGDANDPLLMNPDRMQVYRLTSFAPKPFVDLLNELGDLDPRTQLKIDEDNNAVIAYASLADHIAIRMMMQRLDGSVRKFEVVKLKRLEAAYVAGTIQFMMAPEEEDSSSSRSPYYGFDPFGGGGSSRKKKNTDKFKVDADVENNRLLLWANEVELAEIRNLLTKLGEDPNATGREDLIRVFDVSRGQTPEELLKQVEKLWHLSNPIEVTPQPDPSEPAPATPGETETTATGAGSATNAIHTQMRKPQQQPKAVNPLPNDPAAARFFRELNASREPKINAKRPLSSEPVRLSVRADGKIVVTCRDPEALQAMEQLLARLAPQTRDYKIFRLRHSAPLGVALTLEEFFEDPEKSGSGIEYNPYFGFVPSSKKDQGDVRLSRRRIPRFIPDNYTSTILVQGADRGQLETIAQLIELYDQPEPTDSRSLRMTRMFHIKHSQASVIASAVKDVFRDLLSANDKALGKDQKSESTSERVYTYLDGSDGQEEEESPVKFKGLLSIGIDEYSNTLIVSSTSGLLDTIGQIIDGLDQAARPRETGFKVVPLSPDIDPAMLQNRLQKLFAKPAEKPAKKPTGQPNQPGVPPTANAASGSSTR